MTNQSDNTSLEQALLPGFWGKFDGESGDFHALVHHCADVAACVEALLSLPCIERALAASAGLAHLTSIQKSRLAAIAFLHDLGKIALGFQCQICYPRLPLTPSNKGHIRPIFSLLFDDPDYNAWLVEPLGATDLVMWDSRDGAVVQDLLAAALAHHGAPVNIGSLDAASDIRKQWQPVEHLDPRREAERFGTCLRRWFSDAYEQTENHQLPDSARFHHAYAGLVSLADWIGSDRRFFPFLSEFSDSYIGDARRLAVDAIQSIGLDTIEQRAKFAGIPSPADLFGFPSLRPLQQAVFDSCDATKALILEAETGAGKTEAALLRFAKLYQRGHVDSLYFAVPTRAAAVQLHRRVCEFSRQLFPNEHGPEPVLAVPGYLQAGAHSGHRLPGFVVEWDDAPSQRDAAARWSAEHNKRFLAAQIAVGTIDQVMLSAMPVKHAHLRATALSRSLLVIDELHASDHYMQEIIEHVVQQHTTLGSHVLMMSATLSAEARERWLTSARQSGTALEVAINTGYPCLSCLQDNKIAYQVIAESDHHKQVDLELCPTGHAGISATAWRAARAGARVLIIRNTVKDAVALLLQLQADASTDQSLLFNIDGLVTLHHSRFAAEDRQRLDAAAEAWLGKERPCTGGIVVGTQTLEQSLDIDADLLITDLCPMDVLLQRIGRLQRHRRDIRPQGFQRAKAVVVTPNQSDLSSLIKTSEIGLGPKSPVYPDLLVLQATLDLINQCAAWSIPAMNRQLVEGALHPDIRQQLIDRQGPDWSQADLKRQGSDNADAQSARQHRLRTDKRFLDREVCFKAGAKVPSRLGEDSLMVTLEQPITGPFSQPVANFSIPGWMLKDELSSYDGTPSIVSSATEISLKIGQTTFVYSATGLKEATESD